MSEWQPIETAPKDVNIILVEVQGGKVFAACWVWCNEDSSGGTLTGRWMPLPDPPK